MSVLPCRVSSECPFSVEVSDAHARGQRETHETECRDFIAASNRTVEQFRPSPSWSWSQLGYDRFVDGYPHARILQLANREYDNDPND